MPWIPVKETSYLDSVLAHELGHAFGLGHPEVSFEQGRRKVMGKNDLKTGVEHLVFSLDEVKILDKSIFLAVFRDPYVESIEADVNGDGYVDLSDVLIVRSAVQNSTSYDTDVNNDGKTDEVDVLLVKQKAMEAIVAAAPSLIRRRIQVGTWGGLKNRQGGKKIGK